MFVQTTLSVVNIKMKMSQLNTDLVNDYHYNSQNFIQFLNLREINI